MLGLVNVRVFSTLIFSALLAALLPSSAARGADETAASVQSAMDELDVGLQPANLKAIAQAVQEARNIAHKIKSMKNRAERSGNSTKVACLSGMAGKLNNALQAIDSHSKGLDNALKSSAPDAKDYAKQQMLMLQMYVAEVKNIEAAADACGSDSDLVPGDTRTEFELLYDLQDEDVETLQQEEPYIGVEQPQQGSGFV